MAQRYVAFHTGVEGWLHLNGAAKTGSAKILKAYNLIPSSVAALKPANL